ncbi:hypothetical protein D3C71_2059260 [compost metagenome]
MDGEPAGPCIDKLVGDQGTEVLAAACDNRDFVFQGMVSHVDGPLIWELASTLVGGFHARASPERREMRVDSSTVVAPSMNTFGVAQCRTHP